MKTLFPRAASKTTARSGTQVHRLLLKPLETVAPDIGNDTFEGTGSGVAPRVAPVRYRWLLEGAEQACTKQARTKEIGGEETSNEESGGEGNLEALANWLTEQFGTVKADNADEPSTHTGSSQNPDAHSKRASHVREAVTFPPVCLIIPAARLSTKSMAVSAAESRHLRNLAAFELEDHVAVDIETLHVVCSPVEAERASVSGIDRQWLQAQYLALQALGLDIAHCLSETSLLPLEANSWTLWFDDELLVRRGHYDGFALGASLATAGLRLALAETAAEESPVTDKDPTTIPTSNITHAPLKIKLLASTPARLQTLYDMLPEASRSQVSSQAYGDLWRWPVDFPASLTGQGEPCTEAGDSLGGLELGQGPFARRLPWRRYWQQGRSLFWLASLSLVVLLLVNGIGLYRHTLQQQNLKMAIEQAYRQVMPQGVLVDAVRQLEHQRTQQGGTNTQSEAVALLARVVPLMVANEGVTLKRLSYHNKRRELRLSIDARSFNQIEQLRSAIAVEGLAAQLVSANVRQLKGKASAAQHQARLKINW